ncbi:MAG: hydroxyacid dehydrogenase [Alphaproteobacteria bacterium]|nr:hydroxyacid dehydrogenase [Alphaproteobacteria bacterium]
MQKRLVYFENWSDPIALEILSPAPGILLERIAKDDPAERAAEVFHRAHGYQVRSTRHETPYWVTAALLAGAPNLLAVSAQGAGYDTVDVAACTKAGVLVVNQTGLGSATVAEHVLAVILTLAHRTGESDKAMRRVANIRRQDYIGRDVQGTTLGIIGLGNIGSAVATLCRRAFDMRVLAHDPYIPAARFAEFGATAVSLDQLLRESDFVTVHVPRNAETEGLMGRAQFALMQPTAYFITAARGGIHDEAALHAALVAKTIAGAALDVWAVEPPPLDHPLLALENVIATPHNGGLSAGAYRNLAKGAAEQWLQIFRGEKPPRLVNPEAWEPFRRRWQRIIGNDPS